MTLCTGMETARADQAFDHRCRIVGAGCRAGANIAVAGIVRIINPFPAGGASDAMARLLQPGLQQSLGATIIVENRPGASASIGAAVVAKSPPDGSTWLLTSETFVVSHAAAHQPALRRAEGFRAGDDDRARTDGAVRASLAALSHAARTRRRGEGAARRADLRRPPASAATATSPWPRWASSPACGSCMCLIAAPRRLLNDGTAGHVDMVIARARRSRRRSSPANCAR